VINGRLIEDIQCTFEDGYNTQRIVHDMFNDSENNK